MANDPFLVARMGLRHEWLAQVQEDIIDPDREIIDPHHHFWNRGGYAYELDQLWADTQSGHNITQMVFIECRSSYDETLPEMMQPVGETRYVAAIAEQARAHPDRAQIAAIISHADLRNPELDQVLDAHEAAAQGLFRGIRHAGAWDRDLAALMIPGRGYEGQYSDPAFRRGLARLGERGLTYDTWHYHPLTEDFAEMARTVPQTTLVLNHFGTPLGVGRFKGKRHEIFKAWKDQVAVLAEAPNVIAKLGGLAMPDNGWGWHERALPPSSDEFVETQAEWYHHMIACFGPERCMFESNFPVDRISISYPVLWNGLKKIAASYDEVAQTAMFSGTAKRVYRL